jgi:type IV secretion system protein VirD4
VQALSDAIKIAPPTASGIRKTFTSRLDLWLNPILDQATSDNDFDLRTLREKPQSIYVAVRPDDLHRLRPVLNLFFQQAIGLQTRELPEQNPRLSTKVMMLLDEFTALGRIPIMAESISYLPGYNLRVVLVIQSPSQLREVYGPNNAETMLKSLAARIVFAPKDMADAREISEELGFVTVKSRSRSRSAFWGSRGGRGPTVNESDQRRALMLPQELKELGNDKAIVFYEGLPPILCRKVRYFESWVFRKRLLPPPAPCPERPAPAAPPPGEDPWISGGEMRCDDDTPPLEPRVVRPAGPAHPGHIDQLTLVDFAITAATTDVVDVLALADPESTPSHYHDSAAAFIASFS